jgi:hypothetical protein
MSAAEFSAMIYREWEAKMRLCKNADVCKGGECCTKETWCFEENEK